MNNRNFYKNAKQYAISKLAKYYQDTEKCSINKAKEKAEAKIAILVKPVAECNVYDSKATLSKIYERLLTSCQNRSMMPKVIKFDANRRVFADLLANFEPTKVLRKYKSADDVYLAFEKKFNINKDHNTLWKLFAESVIDSAKFISKYKNVADFKQTIDSIAVHFPGTMMIPRLVSDEIRGLGEVLACDFIKEIGYIEYAKPDVHIEYIVKKICKNDKMTAKEILAKIQEISKEAGVSTFEVDKILWLIASGKYYDVNLIEPTIVIKSENKKLNLRDEFLSTIK